MHLDEMDRENKRLGIVTGLTLVVTICAGFLDTLVRTVIPGVM